MTFTDGTDWLRVAAYGFVRHAAAPATTRGGFGIGRHESHI